MAPINAVRLPSPGDDATPFLLRCYVKPAPFRNPADFDQLTRPLGDEYKLYVWRSATLRDVASLLHSANPRLSQPTSEHEFRLVYYDSRQERWVHRHGASGVTRVALKAVEELGLQGLREEGGRGKGEDTMDEVQDGASPAATGEVEDKASEEARATSASDKKAPFIKPNLEVALAPLRPIVSARRAEVDEAASRTTLAELEIVDGDILDCVILPPSAAANGSSSSASTKLEGIEVRGRGSRAAMERSTFRGAAVPPPPPVGAPHPADALLTAAPVGGGGASRGRFAPLPVPPSGPGGGGGGGRQELFGGRGAPLRGRGGGDSWERPRRGEEERGWGRREAARERGRDVAGQRAWGGERRDGRSTPPPDDAEAGEERERGGTMTRRRGLPPHLAKRDDFAPRSGSERDRSGRGGERRERYGRDRYVERERERETGGDRMRDRSRSRSPVKRRERSWSRD